MPTNTDSNGVEGTLTAEVDIQLASSMTLGVTGVYSRCWALTPAQAYSGFGFVVSQERLAAHERFERTAAVDPSLRLFGVSATILRPRVGDVQGVADESPTALNSNRDNSSSTSSGSFKPPTTVAQPHSNPAHAAVSHHTTGAHTGKLKTR